MTKSKSTNNMNKLFIVQITREFTWRFEHYHVEDYETVGGVTHWDERRFLWFVVKYNIYRILDK